MTDAPPPQPKQDATKAKRAAKEALMDIGFTEYAARQVVLAVCAGEIPNLKFEPST